MPRKLQADVATHAETWRFDGAVNVLLLFAIVGAVFLPDKNFPARGRECSAAAVV